MFKKATLRLTAWYVAILMALSLAFSAWLYAEATHEVRTGLNAQLLSPISRLLPHDDVVVFLNKQYDAAQSRILGSLALLNAGVFIAGSAGSYVLARRTLRPIEDALESQNRFTADASHELRTPLAAMKTEIEVALRDKTLPAKATRELLDSNVEEIDRLTKLVDGLLVLARSPDKPAINSIALDEVVLGVCERFEAQAARAGKVIRQQITPLKAKGNAAHVDTITGILIDNAIKYGEPKSTLTVQVVARDGQACLSVHNTGAAIAPSDLAHIFERFYRADTARTGGAAAGHGLGLSIAQKLAGTMHGTIAVKSNKVNGTTFTLRLPPA